MRDKYTFSGDFRGATLNLRSESRSEQLSANLAWQKFACLAELDPPSALGPLPQGSVMPWASNPLFVARERELKALAAALGGENPSGAVHAAATGGLGGVGKTQTAVEFVHRYGRYFSGGVFWISCSDPGTIAAQVAACGGANGLNLQPDFEGLSQPEQIAAVQRVWAEPYPRLLVLDNCESEETFQQWRPVSGGTKILVTSRRAEWSVSLGVKSCLLDTMDRPDSVRMLESFDPSLSDHSETLSAIADELGDLPLALHMAGSFLGRYRRSTIGEPARYLENLRNSALNHPSMKSGDLSPTGHDLNVARTFAQSYDALDRDVDIDAGALAILHILCAHAPGELVPRAYILSRSDNGKTEEELEIGKADAIRRLSDLGLVAEQGDSLYVHRLISEFVRPLLDPEIVEALAEQMLKSAATSNASGDPRYIAEWEAHLFYVTEQAIGRAAPIGLKLLREVGRHHYNRGALQAARNINERLFSLSTSADRNESPSAEALNDLAVSIRPFEPARAVELLRQSILLQKSHPELDIHTLIVTYQNLGEALLGEPGALEAFEEAKRLFKIVWYRPDDINASDETSKSIEESWVEVDADELWARIICGIARIHGQTDPVEAEAALRLDLQPEDPSAAGFRHWKVLERLGNLALDRREYAAAEAHFHRALDLIEQQIGPEASVGGDALFRLGECYSRQGKNSLAAATHKKAFDLALKSLDWHHPVTRIYSDAYWMAQSKSGDFSAVIDHLVKRLEAAARAPVGQSDQIPHLLFGLGFCHFALNEIDQAEKYWTRTIRAGRRDPRRYRESMRSAKSFLKSISTSKQGRGYARPL